MASQTDEAERRVREQRALIQQKLSSLEDRVGEDLTHAQDRLKHHVTHAADMLPGGPAIIQQVESHPAAAIMGGLGLGVAAGMMSSGGSDNGSTRDGYRRDGYDGGGRDSSRGGAAAMMFGGLTSSLIAPLRPYMEEAAKQVIAGFADRQRGGSHDSSSTPRGDSPAGPTPGPSDSPRWGDAPEPASGNRRGSTG